MTRIVRSLSILLLTCSGVLLGGDWSIGATASPAITIPHTSLNLPSPKNRFNYSFGIVGIYDLSPNVFAKGGLLYTRKDILLAKNIPDTRLGIDPGSDRIDISRIVYGDASEVYESVTFPITVNYRLTRGETIDLILSGGVETGFLFQRKAIVEPTTSGTWSHIQPEHKFETAVMMGIGVHYALSAGTAVLLIPTYSYSLYPDQDFGSLNFHTISLECAFAFRL
jgi:hypothetical protein